MLAAGMSLNPNSKRTWSHPMLLPPTVCHPSFSASSRWWTARQTRRRYLSVKERFRKTSVLSIMFYCLRWDIMALSFADLIKNCTNIYQFSMERRTVKHYADLSRASVPLLTYFILLNLLSCILAPGCNLFKWLPKLCQFESSVQSFSKSKSEFTVTNEVAVHVLFLSICIIMLVSGGAAHAFYTICPLGTMFSK